MQILILPTGINREGRQKDEQEGNKGFIFKGVALIPSYMYLHKCSESKCLLYLPCSHHKLEFLCHLTSVTVTSSFLEYFR